MLDKFVSAEHPIELKFKVYIPTILLGYVWHEADFIQMKHT